MRQRKAPHKKQVIDKQVIGILAGGKSAEHEVSLRSARTVMENLNLEKYRPIEILVDRTGKWQLQATGQSVILNTNAGQGELLDRENCQLVTKLDVLFPVLHGPYGEDGSVQGLAKLANLPCVGAGILGSAVAMDKDVMRRLLVAAGIEVCPYKVIHRHDKQQHSYEQLQKKLGSVLFVKPANMGSSVGISRVDTAALFETALEHAFAYDKKVVVEQAVQGRELEISVLGNDQPQVSVAGEILTHDVFYSYQTKYASDSPAELLIPAPLTAGQLQNIQQIALQVFAILECRGMARVDLFLTNKNKVLINELNTIPGFTSISMYPKLWEASGMPITKLIDVLIKLALQEFADQAALLDTF